MKKIIVLTMLMLMASLCFGGDVYLIKSKFTPNYWQAFIPADDTGEYYFQVGFGTPMDDDLYLPNFTMLDMTYGKLCDAKQASMAVSAGTINTTDFGYGSRNWGVAAGALDGDFIYAYETGDGSTRFMTYDPPDTHNELHVFIYLTGNAQSDCAISWSDASTAGLTLTDLGSTAGTGGIRELIVYKNTTAIGNKVLKFVPANGKIIRILGIRSWDTNTKGDLSSDTDDCLVTAFTQVSASGGLCRLNPALCNNAANTFNITSNTTIGMAYEYAFQWDSGGTDYDFSGGNQHYTADATNNPYVMASAYTTDGVGPEIFVDGVSKGGVYAAENTRGIAYTGQRIVIHSKGTLTGQTSGTAPNHDLTYIIDRTGVTVTATTTWQSNIAFAATPLIYAPMMPFSAVIDAGATIRFPLTSTWIAVPAIDTEYTDVGSICELYYNNAIIRMTSFCPIYSWKYSNSSSKIYGTIKDSFPGAPTPAAGDVLNLGCKYEVRRVKTNYTETWQGINAASGWLSNF